MDVRRMRRNQNYVIRTIRHSIFYHRFRHLLRRPREPFITDDRDSLDRGVPVVLMDWPQGLPKPRVGLIRDCGVHPHWTKYRRLLEANGISFVIYDIHALGWREEAGRYDVIVGASSCEPSRLQEMRRKYYILQSHMRKKCCPSYEDMLLYEDKMLESYLSEVHGLPFARTHIFTRKQEALAAADGFTYPIVSKVVPGSGSVGVELIKSRSRCRAVIERAFSPPGRWTHYPYAAQKDYVYFQDYVPNDGHDLRVIVVGCRMIGYYRKVPNGDFRASGMGLEEAREVPLEALRIARRAYEAVKSPMLAVDMVKNHDGEYHIIEMSPVCGVDTPDECGVRGVPGFYVVDGDSYSFQEGRLWVQELALKEFFCREYGAR